MYELKMMRFEMDLQRPHWVEHPVTRWKERQTDEFKEKEEKRRVRKLETNEHT